MISNIKILLKKIIPSQTRGNLKKVKRHIKSFFKNGNKNKTSIKELEKALRKDLGIKKGDKIMVTSSFGYLNASFSPTEAVQLLMDIITEEGTIMMPYYPPMNSDEWAKGSHIFDMKETKSGMGIITNVFSKMPNVHKSVHPTKAVCVWGKDAEFIIKDHETATTPFYWDSPYGKFLKSGCKTLGLGVTNNPIFHAIEDILSEPCTKYYENKKYRLKLITADKETEEIETYIHDTKIISKCISSGEYIKTLGCDSYKKIEFGYSFIYNIDNLEVLEKLKTIVANGNNKLRQK